MIDPDISTADALRLLTVPAIDRPDDPLGMDRRRFLQMMGYGVGAGALMGGGVAALALLAASVVSIGFVIWVGTRPSDAGDNLYGPPPVKLITAI